ncbi:MAG: rhodanese-like domain-containing protein [Phycisphaerales bacterium JB047]
MSDAEKFAELENPPRWHFQDGLEISVPETAQRLHADDAGFVLIDIREPDELAVCSVKGAVHIPMGDLATRIHEIDADEDTTVALICHTGRRSLKATLYLQQQGLAGTRSVAGGIDWWSLRIDPSVPRY